MSWLARGRCLGPSSGSRIRCCFPAGLWPRRRCMPRFLLGAARMSRSSFPSSLGRSALRRILLGAFSSTCPNCSSTPDARSAGSTGVSGSSRLTGFCIRPVLVRRRAATVAGTASATGCAATRRSPRRRPRRRCRRSSLRTRMMMIIRSRPTLRGSDGVGPSVCRRRPWRRRPPEPSARLRRWFDFLRSRSRPPLCAPLPFLRSFLWMRYLPRLPSTLDRRARGSRRLSLLRPRRRRRVRKSARLQLLLSNVHRGCLLQSFPGRSRSPFSTGWLRRSSPVSGLPVLM